MLTNLSLFSGIGGLDLAAEWAGFSTVGQCEWADYPYAILEKHWPDVPKWRDIRSLTKESFYAKKGARKICVQNGIYFGFCRVCSRIGKCMEVSIYLRHQWRCHFYFIVFILLTFIGTANSDL